MTSDSRTPAPGSRRLVLAGVIGPETAQVYGPADAARSLIAAIREGRQQPRGHLLRLRQEQREAAARRGPRCP